MVDTTAIKVEPAKKEPPPAVVKKEVKKEPKPGDLAQAFALAKPKKSPEAKSADAESKRAATGPSTKNAPKKGAANNIASMFAKQVKAVSSPQ